AHVQDRDPPDRCCRSGSWNGHAPNLPIRGAEHISCTAPAAGLRARRMSGARWPILTCGRAIRRFTVRTVLPEPLSGLNALALNLRWAWHEPTRRLLAGIDPQLWQEVHGDPAR